MHPASEEVPRIPICRWPVKCRRDWVEWVNQPETSGRWRRSSVRSGTIAPSSPWLKSRGRCLRLRAGLFVVETCPYLAAILLRLDASIPARIRGASARGTLTTGCYGPPAWTATVEKQPGLGPLRPRGRPRKEIANEMDLSR